MHVPTPVRTLRELFLIVRDVDTPHHLLRASA
jgi:hypothetical protein